MCQTRRIITLLGLVTLTWGGIVHISGPAIAGTRHHSGETTRVTPLQSESSVVQSHTEGEIQPHASSYLTVNLSDEQYVRLLIYHSDVNLSILASKPNGDVLTDFNCNSEGPTPLSLISSGANQIRLELRNNSPKLTARYSIILSTPRRVVSSDLLRMEGEKSFREAELLQRTLTAVSLQSALPRYENALKQFQAAHDQVGTVLTLRGLSKTYQSLDQRDKALDQFARAFTLAKQIDNLSFAADISNDLAYLHFGVGETTLALSRSREALRLSRKSRHQGAESTAKFLLGESYYGLGDLNRALSYYDEGLNSANELGRFRQQIQVLVARAYSLGEQGKIAEAKGSYDEALGMSVDLGDARWQAITLRGLGNLQTNLGDKQEALESLHKAWELIKDFNDSPTKAATLGALGYIYSTAGEYRVALEFYNNTRTLFSNMGHHWGAAELEMEVGNIHILLGEPALALSYYDKALHSFRSLQMVRYQAQTLKNMGLAQELLGNSEKAVELLNQSLSLNRVDQDQRYQAYTLNYLGKVYHNSTDYLSALQYYKKALRLSEVGADPFGQSQTLYNQAATHLALGNLDTALSDSKQSLSIIESLRTKVASQYLRSAYLASVHQHYELQIGILMALSEKHGSQTFAASALEASEQARARSLVEALAETHANIRQGVDPALLAREQELQRELNSKAIRQVRLLNTGEEGTTLREEIQKLSIEHDEVQGLIRAKSPRYAALTQSRPLSVKEIQEKILDDESLLLEYALGEERSFLWAVTHDNLWSYQLPGKAEIESAAQDLYRSLTARQPVPGESVDSWKARTAKANDEFAAQLSSLSATLLEPVAARLNKKHLIIVADGALQYIPFQILTKPVEGSDRANTSVKERSLVTEHVITNQPSASALALLLAEKTNRRPAENSVAVLADPVFETNDPRLGTRTTTKTVESDAAAGRDVHRALRDVGLSKDGIRIPRLPASRDEANAIISAAPWWSTFQAVGFEATREAAMKPELADYRTVHFATHGILNNEHPELSGIVLSLVDRHGQPQDGFLRLHDIYNLRLPVDLVVLSACNTGLGKDVRGEGLIGLTRGFMYAGARSVVASLWKVDDEATAELMRHFYKFMLQDNLSPPEALRAAQLQMRKEKRWQSPYYWSGFIIQGQYVQPEPVFRFHLKSGAVLVVLSAVLMAAMILLIRRRRKNVF